jgi:hypothetical protein
MMARRENVTDRALRYRAQRNVTGPKRCVICGSTRNIDVMHLDGNESHGEPENLAYGCRSCNGKLAAAFKAAGMGRPTNQYNPGATSVGEWLSAVFAAQLRRHNPSREPGNFIGDLFGLTGGDRIYKEGKGAAHSGKLFGASSPAQVRKRAAADKRFERKQDRASAANAKFLEREAARERVAGEKRERKEAIASKPVSAGIYKGYTISKTPDGEYFSSLDRSSWFDTVAQAKRHIDQYQKGRGNPGQHVLYHNIIQNRDVRGADDVVQDIISDGFKGRSVWLSSRPVDDGQGRFIGVAVHIPKGFSLSEYRQEGDAIEDHHVKVYEIPAELVNKMRRTRPRFSERQLVHLNPGGSGPNVAMPKYSNRNPAAASAQAFEDFHGHPSTELVVLTKKVHIHEHLAAAGELRALVVKGVDGQVHTIKGFKGALLAFNEALNQLFVEGGDQSLNLADFGISRPHELETLGKVKAIDYHTTKSHLGDEGGTAVYAHQFRTTNENGRHVVVEIARYPDLIYRTLDQQFEFSGGSYVIRAEGIDK